MSSNTRQTSDTDFQIYKTPKTQPIQESINDTVVEKVETPVIEPAVEDSPVEAILADTQNEVKNNVEVSSEDIKTPQPVVDQPTETVVSKKKKSGDRKGYFSF